MKGQGSAHLFVYYQKPYRVTETGEIDEYKGGREEFYITDGKCSNFITRLISLGALIFKF